MKKVLITGATGMLGSDFVRLLKANEQYDVYGAGRSVSKYLPLDKQFIVDFSNPMKIKDLPISPDVIIHTAALTDLNACERNPKLAHKIHVESSYELAKLCKKDTFFFYISTDSVFDGVKGSYSENDTPNPLNVYAQSKLKGENAVMEENQGLTTIVRTNIYGFNLPLKNSLAEWAYHGWSVGNTIPGFSDIFFNAVFTGQLVSTIKILMESNLKYRILNIGSNTVISKYDFLEKFRRALGVKINLLKPALSSDFLSPISRPKNTSLDISLLSDFCQPPDFDSGIKEWINLATSTGLLKIQ
jgi:dTDP-4-dehydrorhamnose reductase